MLNKEPTYFKNCINPSSIDLHLTNFQSTLTIENSLRKLIVTAVRVDHETFRLKLYNKENREVLT